MIKTKLRCLLLFRFGNTSFKYFSCPKNVSTRRSKIAESIEVFDNIFDKILICSYLLVVKEWIRWKYYSFKLVAQIRWSSNSVVLNSFVLRFICFRFTCSRIRLSTYSLLIGHRFTYPQVHLFLESLVIIFAYPHIHLGSNSLVLIHLDSDSLVFRITYPLLSTYSLRLRFTCLQDRLSTYTLLIFTWAQINLFSDSFNHIFTSHIT